MKKDIFITSQLAFNEIECEWKKWFEPFPKKTMVIGISGGVDSTCVATLACKIFGPENVIGVSLPCDGQKDMSDVDTLFDYLKIKRITLDIGDAFYSLKNGIENNVIDITEQCSTNMPARLRMTALFGIAQCIGGVVINTCQRSESCVGYDTLFGDSCGCYAPIKNLVKTEVMNLAEWLGVPISLARKTPVDGLQPLTDEEKFGFSYNELDTFIRCSTAVQDGLVSEDVAKKIKQMYQANKFKLEIINIPGPSFSFVTDVFRSNLYI